MAEMHFNCPQPLWAAMVAETMGQSHLLTHTVIGQAAVGDWSIFAWVKEVSVSTHPCFPDLSSDDLQCSRCIVEGIPCLDTGRAFEHECRACLIGGTVCWRAAQTQKHRRRHKIFNGRE